MKKAVDTKCPHCGADSIVGFSHPYLRRCTNWSDCARYSYNPVQVSQRELQERRARMLSDGLPAN